MSDEWDARAFEIALWLIVGLAIDLGRTGRPVGDLAADVDPYTAHREAVARLCEAHRAIALAIMRAGPGVTPDELDWLATEALRERGIAVAGVALPASDLAQH
ncbi:MAG: hypothetical protein OXG72_13180 [Acidobacteria bacterium]|nr:hypothetical protein [Acidobacteriota bacterium]